jgi:hypothetical protein
MNKLDKNLYKIFITAIKFIPNILAVMQIISLILSYFKITSFFITCFSGTSIIFLGLLYLISYLFKFCGLYRLSLNYVTLIYILTIIDYYFGIPFSTPELYRLYAFITGVFMSSWIYIWYKNRKNPKIDHIKQLCDKYIDCSC